MSDISFFKIARSLGILGIMGLLFCVSCKGKPEAEPSSPPNILFIMSDDHTSQAWGIYGGPLKDYVRNENIKRLASEGAVLNNTFCTNSICAPSRGTILTGQYSHMNGVYTLTDALEPDSLNIAKFFQENGYHTAIIGKWHLKKQPSGFDYFNVLPGQGVYHDPILKTKENWQDSQEGGAKYEGFSTDVITDLSIKWMDTISKEKPFLLMTHFKATHEPFDYPERFKNLYADEDIPEPQSLYDFGPETTGRSFKGQSLDNLALRWESASKGPWWCDYPELPFSVEGIDSIAARKKTYQKLVKDFMRSGAAVDENIGKLLDYLEQSGLAENTVVIYTADQGYFLGEHGFFDKRLIYEESLRMPFVIRYPKEIKGGQRIDDIVLNIDFASLFADYAGIDLSESFQGRSFRNNLKGETPKDWRKTMYYRYWTHEPIRPAHFGIRNERYKLALFYGRSLDVNLYQNENTEPAWEFYDLEKDPHENHNAFNDPQYAEVIAEMRQELLEQRENVGDTDADHPEVLEILNSHWN